MTSKGVVLERCSLVELSSFARIGAYEPEQNDQISAAPPKIISQTQAYRTAARRMFSPTLSITQRRLHRRIGCGVTRPLEVVVGQAPVDAVIERCGRGIKISPDQGAPYAARADGRYVRG
jgi:hypothetical protein